VLGDQALTVHRAELAPQAADVDVDGAAVAPDVPAVRPVRGPGGLCPARIRFSRVPQAPFASQASTALARPPVDRGGNDTDVPSVPLRWVHD